MMAITKLLNIKAAEAGCQHSSLMNALKYIVNGAKTEGGTFVGVNNILLNDGNIVRTAYDQMVETKQVFDNLDKRQGYHFIISFPKDEDVAPEQAMEIAREFCEGPLKEYEVVYAIHVDKKHTHIHLVFNSVSFTDGIKYRYKKNDWRKILQPFVNEACRKRGLSEIDVNVPGKKNKNHAQWEREQEAQQTAESGCHPERSEGSFYSYARIRVDLDHCIHKASSYAEFLSLMQQASYTIDDSRKHLRIYAPGRERAVRSYILTPDKATYTKENIRRMISGTYKPENRREILSRMYKDWNVFLSTQRIKVTHPRHSTLEFAQKEEAVRMLLDHGIKTVTDAEVYLQYLESADKELNIIRHYANSHIERYKQYAPEMSVIIDYAKNKEQYYVDGLLTEKRHEAEATFRQLLDAGINPADLYKTNKLATHILECVDAYKKKLFVDKIKVKRAEEMMVKKQKDIHEMSVR